LTIATQHNADELHDAAEQLLSDIEGMVVEGRHAFGEFSEWRMHPDGEGIVIVRPNLAISADRLRAALAAISKRPRV